MQKTYRPETIEHPSQNTEQIAPTDSRYGIISVDPERLSGSPCFAGTRVPIKNMFDYLETGETLDDFLEGFPGVSRDQAVAVLHLACERLICKSCTG